MLIIPAIDLQDGRCVRLEQGQFNKVTVFGDSPIEKASYFAQAGAKRIHIVDLDGAKTGSMQQLPLITAMQNGVEVQAGGGIRTFEEAQKCIDAGISRIVLGSIAIIDKPLTKKIITTLGAERIVLAIDVQLVNQIPIPSVHGWQTTSDTSLWDVVSYYQELGISDILCTDIACDGMMGGPNLVLYAEAVARFPQLFWQASGGIRNQMDIERLKTIGIKAAILGLTLYQGEFDLPKYLAEEQETELLC
ncbi:MAG: 1-(5-phosphoribosyl)-5-[(5-phosphoribosylamino)methylideneamino] imidazole-4-carboxamide isomerase [Legionella sp.]|nr:1-(5-phosphoribosyl)-5-[(5-phosphoribosylamino)methylideneamino] imidazole-4-carboxamide isomerase [Legionella sp.]